MRSSIGENANHCYMVKTWIPKLKTQIYSAIYKIICLHDICRFLKSMSKIDTSSNPPVKMYINLKNLEF